MSVKIKAAKKLLILTQKDMTEIALETGFSTSSHFISCFKKYTGMTPKCFRMKADVSTD